MTVAHEHAVLIIGCGFTGTLLAQRLAFAGQPVIGTTRTQSRATIIRTRGAQPLVWDTSDIAALSKLRGRVGAVVYSVPPKMHPDTSFEDATQRVLETVAGWDLSAFVYVSSTSVYGDQAGAVADEDTPCMPDSPRGKARLSIEKQVLSAPVRGMVVRPAGIYGPGRSQLHRHAAGRTRLVAGGQAFTNRVHVRDLAALLALALEHGEPGAVYLGSDEAPARQADVARHIVQTYALPAPAEISLAEARVRLSKDVLAMITGSKQLDAHKTRDQLGWRLRFPTYREGLDDIWAREAGEIRALVTAAAP